MKTVVITGSARGFGYAMIELFRKKGFHVVLSDINQKALQEAEEKLKKFQVKQKFFLLSQMLQKKRKFNI